MSLSKKPGGLFHEKINALNPSQNAWLRGLNGSSLSFLIQSLVLQHHKNCLVIASDKEKAAYLLNDLDALFEDRHVLFFPESYKQPYQVEKTTNANIQERAEVLNLLSKENLKGLVVTYPQALSEKVALKKQLHKKQKMLLQKSKRSQR